MECVISSIWRSVGAVGEGFMLAGGYTLWWRKVSKAKATKSTVRNVEFKFHSHADL
jgi:hypothetical protein